MFFGLTKAKANAKLQRAFATRNFADAIEAYRKMIVKNPNDHELFNNLGVAYLESGALSESVEAFQKANLILPACVHFNNLGRALLERKQYQAAREAFAKGRELDASDPQPWYNITVALRNEGRTDEAQVELIEFLQANPTHANGLNDIGCHYLDLGETDEAMKCFKKAVVVDPFGISARLNLIRLLCDSKQYPEATPHLEILAKQGLNIRVHADKNNMVSIDINGAPFYRTPNSA